MPPRPSARSSEPASTPSPHARKPTTGLQTRWDGVGALLVWGAMSAGCGPISYATPDPVLVIDGVELKETARPWWTTRFDAVCIERASGERQCATQIEEYDWGPDICPNCSSLAWGEPTNILGEPDALNCLGQTAWMKMNPQGYIRVSFGGEIELHPGDGIAVFTVYHPLASNCPPSPYEVSLLRQGKVEFLCTSDISTVCYVGAG